MQRKRQRGHDDRHKRPWNPEVHKILLSREVVANQDPERPMEANIGTIDA